MNRPFLQLLILIALLLSGAGRLLAQYADGQQAFDAQDYPRAQAAWQKGAAAGDAKSQYSLGYLAQFGLVGGSDPVAAKGWYEKAAANKSADALYALGLMYESGQAGEKDLAKALDYYRQAAAAGPQSDAEYAIGRMLLRGRGVPRDAKESVAWLRKAALKNNPAAQYMLAAACEAGWGMKVNEGEAYYWYRRADQGDPVELEEQDVAFEPKIAIAALRRRLSPEIIALWDEKLRHEAAPPQPPVKETAKNRPPALTQPADH
jgi:TPR repeat protein